MDSIVEWIHSFFEDQVLTTSSGDDFRVDCPFCGDDKAHLYISIHRPVAHCFKCEWRGSWLHLVKEAAGLDSYAEAAQQLRHPLGLVDFESVVDRLKSRSRKTLRDSNHHARMPEWFVPFGVRMDGLNAKMVLTYALRRIDLDDVLHYGMGYCADLDHMCAWRLVVPVERGYWTARAVLPQVEPKYMTPEFSQSDRLFNPAALSYSGTLLVAEGAFSGIALGHDAVATLGKSATDAQAERIASSKANRVIIAFDADARAGSRTLALADYQLDRGKQVYIRRYAWGDPDDCTLWNDVEYNWGYKARVRLSGQ